MKLIGYSEADSKQIPKTQGLYAFYLHAINLEKVGLLGKGPFGTDQLINAKHGLLRRLDKVLAFMRCSELKGTVSSLNKSNLIADSFLVELSEQVPMRLKKDIEDIPNDLLPNYLRSLDFLSLLAQPIYVGITASQTLFERYYQHKRDFERGNEGVFGGRLSQANFEWGDLIFACVSLTNDEFDLRILPILEKHLQVISKPVLSLA